MKNSFSYALKTLLFPHTCAACGSNQLARDQGICNSCLWDLPFTGFLSMPNNSVEQVFWGRLHLQHAAALHFFTKGSAIQEVLHQLKYSNRKELGMQLGRWMGAALLRTNWAATVSALVPMPIHPKRLQERGYNQAALLAEGIGSVTGIPVCTSAVARKTRTESQTRQHRWERWENMQDVFEINTAFEFSHKHVLMIDDVITTGASLEALGNTISRIKDTQLSIYSLAYTLPH